MSTRRKPRPSRAKSSPSKSSPLKPSPLNPSPVNSSPVNSSPLKSSKASKKLPSIPASEVGDDSMEGLASFNNEQSSTLLSPDSDLAPDTSTSNREQSSAPQANASASADNQIGKRARTVSELPSLPLPSDRPLSNAFINQLRQLITRGPLVPSLSHTQNLYTRHVLHKGFVFSLFECSVICAIQMFIQNQDGSWADDDTATEVLRAMRNTTSTVDCQGLYDQMILQGSAGIQGSDDWEAQVYNEIQSRNLLWADVAQAYWRGWIASMNNICRHYKDAGRLGELTGVVPVVDVEPFRTVYESGQTLSFMQRMPVQRNRQRPNQMRLPNQWANQTAMLNPMQMQFSDQVPNSMMLPMSPQTQMQMHNTWEDQVRMPGPAPMQFQNQWPSQMPMPVMAEYPVQGASQMRTYQQLQNQQLQNQQLQNQRRLQMQMQMELQPQVYLPQMEQMPADTMLLIPSTTELQMPAPQRPVEASDIASIATQMLTPFPVQPPTLPTQASPLKTPRRRAKDDIVQE